MAGVPKARAPDRGAVSTAPKGGWHPYWVSALPLPSYQSFRLWAEQRVVRIPHSPLLGFTVFFLRLLQNDTLNVYMSPHSPEGLWLLVLEEAAHTPPVHLLAHFLLPG